MAERKVEALMRAGASVLVVSPEVTDGLSGLAAAGEIRYRRAEFVPSDLDGVCLVVGATDNEATNKRVFEEADKRGVLCNTVDQPRMSSFIVPAVLERGQIQMAISTSGASPALAQRLKREISEVVGEEYARLAEIMAAIRPRVQMAVSEASQRAEILHQVVESDVLDLLRSGRVTEAERRVEDLLRANGLT